MSETEDKIILKQQEQLEAQAKQIKSLEAKVVPTKTWFSKEMLGIYTAILGGVGAWGNNYLEDLKRDETVKTTQVASANLDAGAFQYVDQTADAIYDTCGLYFEAVVQALPEHQQRRVDRFLETEGGLESEVEEAPPRPAPRITARRPASADAPAVVEEAGDEGFEGETEVMAEVTETIEPEPPAAAPSPYDHILQSSKDPKQLMQKLDEMVQQKARKSRQRLRK